MSLDNALWLVSFVAETAVVGLILYRRVWRAFPAFCSYCVWLLLVEIAAFPVLRFFTIAYLTFYLACAVAYSALEIAVLIELAWSVLRPFRAALPRGALVLVAALVFALAAAVWPFAIIPGFNNWPQEWHLLMRLQQTTAILRIMFFVLLAGFSQLLSIGWRDRELQVATGLGFYSFVSLTIAILHTHLTAWPQYSHLNQIELCGYIFSLLYWVWCFAQKEAERREFTPQMQNLLLAMAGTAKATRIALADSAAAKMRKPGE